MREITDLLDSIEDDVPSDTSENVVDSLFDIDENGKTIGDEDEDEDNTSTTCGLNLNGATLTSNITTSGYSNSNMIYGSTGWSTTPITYTLDDIKDKAINIDRIKALDEVERKLVLDLLEQLDNSSQNMQRMILNTMEVYGIFEDKVVVARKQKIKGVM
jgi:hypothetical protein